MSLPPQSIGPSSNGDDYYAQLGLEVLHEQTTFGDPYTFAVGAGVAYRHRDWHMSLGHFCIHIDGFRYGIVTPDATALGNSFGELQHRILRQGDHRCYFSNRPAAEIAIAYRTSFMGEELRSASFNYFGQRESVFKHALGQSHAEWAPDGDEAFDDSSYVLQFDLDDDFCRLVGFRAAEDGLFDPDTLREVTLTSTSFYAIIHACETWFADKMKTPERKRLPNVSLRDRYLP